MASSEEIYSDMETSQASQTSPTKKASREDNVTPSKRTRKAFDFFAELKAKKMRVDICEPDEFTLIKEINSKTGREEILKFRVIWSSGAVKTSANGKKYFKFVAMDNSGKIPICGFDDLAQKFSNEIKVGETYKLIGFKVEEQNPKYQITGHQFSLTLQDHSNLAPIEETDIRESPYDFKLIADLRKLPKGARADFLGVMVEEYGMEKRSIKGRLVDVKDVSFVDFNGDTEMLTFFENMAHSFQFKEKEVAAIGNVVVNDYGGEKYFNVYETAIVQNPATGKESMELKTKFDSLVGEAGSDSEVDN